MRQEGVVSGFVANLARALRCWRRDPRLLVTALVIWALVIAPILVARAVDDSAVGSLNVLVSIATLGFLGAERVWYHEIDAGRHLPGREVYALSRSLWKRFFGLGVYAFVLMLVPAFVAAAVGSGNAVAGRVLLLAIILTLDILLTFATVALAFWEMKAGDAVRYSWAVAKAQWPQCALYVFAAPLALNLVFTVIPYRDMPAVVYVLVSLAIALFGLACKGATLFFYSDRYLSASAPLPSPPEIS